MRSLCFYVGNGLNVLSFIWFFAFAVPLPSIPAVGARQNESFSATRTESNAHVVSLTASTTQTPDEKSKTKTYQDILVGCLLSIGGNLLISLSLTLQKWTHQRIQTDYEPDTHVYYRDKRWWFAVTLMVLGEVGNFSAYGYAPASLVAPLGTTTVIANMFLAVLVLKEKLRPEDIFGCALAVIGAFLIVHFSSKHDQVMAGDEIVTALRSTSFLIYLSIELTLMAMMLLLLYRFNMQNLVVILMLNALFASFTVISTKAVSSMLQITLRGHNQLTHYIFYIMLLILVSTAVLQVKYLNQAMSLFDATLVVPTYFVLFTISAITAGIIFYREFWGMKALAVFMFLFGCLLCFVGVYFITSGRAGASLEHFTEQVEEERKKFVANFVPTWLFTNVNQSAVQPKITRPSASQSDSAALLKASLDSMDWEEPAGSSARKEVVAPGSESMRSRFPAATNGELHGNNEQTDYGSLNPPAFIGGQPNT